MPNWADESLRIVTGPSHPLDDLQGYREANADMIRRAMRGGSAHSSSANPRLGMRIVYNISSAHVPAVLGAGAASNKPYQNHYDRRDRLGEKPPANMPLRERVDLAVAEVASSGRPRVDPSDIYYGALELNGAGVRFFGDVSMVLKPGSIAADTMLLFRNSYDVSCRPVQAIVPGDRDESHRRMVAALSKWEGRWPGDAPEMAVCKILDEDRQGTRRMTVGTISAGLLDDEDYIEIARLESFGADELQELRLSATDAAAEARIADRIRTGPPPSLAELQWRHRRRTAERAAHGNDLKSRVVVTLGRARA